MSAKERRLAELVDAIRLRGRRQLEDIIGIGKDLTEAKRLVGHGKWGKWLKENFGWTQSTASAYMRIAKVKLRGTLNLNIATLSKLASRSTPSAVRDEIIERATRGERITERDIRDRIARLPERGEPAPVLSNYEDNPAPEDPATIEVYNLAQELEETLPKLVGLGNVPDSELEQLDQHLEAVRRVVKRELDRRQRRSLRVIEGGRS